jgi:hypothetical protein
LVNEPLRWDQLQGVTEFAVGGVWGIDSSGPERIDDIKQALSNRTPVCGGFYVSRNFSAYRGDGLLAPDSAPGGGMHYVMFYGYDGDRFYGLNSWGEHWGVGGHFVCGPEFLLDSQARAFLVVQVQPAAS